MAKMNLTPTAIIAIFGLIVNLPKFSTQNACTPDPRANDTQYIVGYGSLVSSASKNRTYPGTGENIPVRISGFQRVWNVKGVTTGLSTTYLGIILGNSTDHVNGVVFSLPSPAALLEYDQRETFYCRRDVPINSIQILDKNASYLAQGQYWIYVTKPEFTAPPSEDFPIVQSYVDTFLSGCLEVESKFGLKNFADECVNSTKGWDGPWTNDRIFPRRPFFHEPSAGKVDKLLASVIPKEFKRYTDSQKDLHSGTSHAIVKPQNIFAIFLVYVLIKN